MFYTFLSIKCWVSAIKLLQERKSRKRASPENIHDIPPSGIVFVFPHIHLSLTIILPGFQVRKPETQFEEFKPDKEVETLA